MTKLGKLLKLIIAHADQLKKAKDDIHNLNYQVLTHLVKIMLWKNTTGDLSHWAQELTAWLYPLANIKVKTKSGKLSQRDYEKNLFDPKAETLEEFKDFTENTYNNLVVSYNYPKTTWDIKLLWKYFKNFKIKCLELLVSKNKVTEQDFKNMIVDSIKDLK